MRLEPWVDDPGWFLCHLPRGAPRSPQAHGPIGAARREVRVALRERGDGAVVPGYLLDGTLDLHPRVPDSTYAIGTPRDDEPAREASLLFPQGEHAADPAAVSVEQPAVLRHRHVVVEHHESPVGHLTVLPSREHGAQIGHPRHARQLGVSGLYVYLLH